MPAAGWQAGLVKTVPWLVVAAGVGRESQLLRESLAASSPMPGPDLVPEATAPAAPLPAPAAASALGMALDVLELAGGAPPCMLTRKGVGTAILRGSGAGDRSLSR